MICASLQWLQDDAARRMQDDTVPSQEVADSVSSEGVPSWLAAKSAEQERERLQQVKRERQLRRDAVKQRIADLRNANLLTERRTIRPPVEEKTPETDSELKFLLEESAPSSHKRARTESEFGMRRKDADLDSDSSESSDSDEEGDLEDVKVCFRCFFSHG